MIKSKFLVHSTPLYTFARTSFLITPWSVLCVLLYIDTAWLYYIFQFITFVCYYAVFLTLGYIELTHEGIIYRLPLAAKIIIPWKHVHCAGSASFNHAFSKVTYLYFSKQHMREQPNPFRFKECILVAVQPNLLNSVSHYWDKKKTEYFFHDIIELASESYSHLLIPRGYSTFIRILLLLVCIFCVCGTIFTCDLRWLIIFFLCSILFIATYCVKAR